MTCTPTHHWPTRRQLAVIGPCVTVILLGAALLAVRWTTDFATAADNGWVGKSRWAVRLFVPSPDNSFAMDGYDETWSNFLWLDLSVVTAVKYDQAGRITASDRFLINDDDPENVRIEAYPPEDG